MTKLLPLALALAAVNATLEDPAALVLERERARHQGAWLVTSFVSEGRASPVEVARTITRTVNGDHVVWKRDGKAFAGTSMEINPTTSPASIDILPDGGKNRGHRVLGIYRFDGEDLTICMAGAGKERPGAFSAENGSGRTLMVFRREPVQTPRRQGKPRRSRFR